MQEFYKSVLKQVLSYWNEGGGGEGCLCVRQDMYDKMLISIQFFKTQSQILPLIKGFQNKQLGYKRPSSPVHTRTIPDSISC